MEAHRALARQGLGLGHKGPCMSGNWTCATIEHFAAFAPAFARRPFISEQNLSLVVQTDYSLSGQKLALSANISGNILNGEIIGGGYASIGWPMPLLPRNYSATVDITLTLPDGRSRSKPRRFMRASPPLLGMPTSTVQVDHESGGLLMDGVRKTCNGWFNNPNGGIAGLPFLRNSILTECEPFDFACMKTPACVRPNPAISSVVPAGHDCAFCPVQSLSTY
jgi:hypothetical protein